MFETLDSKQDTTENSAKSELLRSYRQQRPNDQSTDRQILFSYYNKKGEDWMRRYAPDALDEYFSEMIAMIEPFSRWEEAKRGHRRSLLNLECTIRCMTSWGLGKFMGREFSKQQLSIGANQLHEAAKPWLQSSSTQPAFSGLGETLPYLALSTLPCIVPITHKSNH